MDERRRCEDDGQHEERRQAEVQLQVVPHLPQSALRQQGGVGRTVLGPPVFLRRLRRPTGLGLSSERGSPLDDGGESHQVQHVAQRSFSHLQTQDLRGQGTQRRPGQRLGTQTNHRSELEGARPTEPPLRQLVLLELLSVDVSY